MVVETMWPEYAPWWLNMFIWMATFWWYILIGFVPAFYVAIAKLFGMPLLQRWSNEVVIMLYPTHVKFRKIKQQFEPYFRDGKGVYWMADPLHPEPCMHVPIKTKERWTKIKDKYEVLAKKESRTIKEEKLMKYLLKQQTKVEKRVLTIEPRNQIQIFSHAINQSITDMNRRETKVDEILNNTASPKKIAGHGIWILQNPKAHFHRHYQLIIKPEGTYQLVPVQDRQQFAIGFWHSLGIIIQKEVESQEEKDLVGGSVGMGKQLVGTMVTTHVILQQMKEVQDYQNFSASRAFMLLKRRAKIEQNFKWDITGQTNPIIWLLLIGMAGAVAAIFFLLHGNAPASTPTAPTQGVHILG